MQAIYSVPVYIALYEATCAVLRIAVARVILPERKMLTRLGCKVLPKTLSHATQEVRRDVKNFHKAWWRNEI
jgi:hypothetical protein